MEEENAEDVARRRRAEQLRFPELVDIDTVARLLAVGERYVRRMVSEQTIPTLKLGHLLRFDLVELRPWIETKRRPARTDQVHRRTTEAPTRSRGPGRGGGGGQRGREEWSS